MTLAERAASYAAAFPKHAAAHPRLVIEQKRAVLYATWVIGADYRNKTRYYGAYPAGYLPRVMALFPEYVTPAFHGHVLHLFSGSLPASPHYVRCDATQDAELRCNVYDLPSLTFAPGQSPRLIIADPPYSAADAVKYETPMVNRGRVFRTLAQITTPGAFVVWLDTVWPMHRKDQWVTVGRILLQRSTNHRTRVVSIFERV